MSTERTAASLKKLTKDSLVAEVLRLEGLVDDMDGDGVHDTLGLLPMELYISGVAWHGNLVRLVRAGTGGELSTKWLVHAGSKMINKDGNPQVSRPVQQIRPKLLELLIFDLPEAKRIAQKLRL